MPAIHTNIAAEYCAKYKRWILSWFKEYYTEYQFIHSYTEFENHLMSAKDLLGVQAYNAINDLWGKLKTKRYKWAYPYKNVKKHFGIMSSSMTEAINGHIKSTASKPLASMSLAESSKVMIYHSNKLEHNRER
jgi:hypothetical protein